MFTSARQVSETGRASLERWMIMHRHYFRGKDVLDFGCGQQPYRSLVEEMGGYYFGYDAPEFPNSQVTEPVGFLIPSDAHFDVILCNQVLTLVRDPLAMLKSFRSRCTVLMLTVDQSYRQFHPDDRWRWTESGLRTLLEAAGFYEHHHDEIFTVDLAPDYQLVLTRGVIAR